MTAGVVCMSSLVPIWSMLNVKDTIHFESSTAVIINQPSHQQPSYISMSDDEYCTCAITGTNNPAHQPIYICETCKLYPINNSNNNVETMENNMRGCEQAMSDGDDTIQTPPEARVKHVVGGMHAWLNRVYGNTQPTWSLMDPCCTQNKHASGVT